MGATRPGDLFCRRVAMVLLSTPQRTTHCFPPISPAAGPGLVLPKILGEFLSSARAVLIVSRNRVTFSFNVLERLHGTVEEPARMSLSSLWPYAGNLQTSVLGPSLRFSGSLSNPLLTMITRVRAFERRPLSPLSCRSFTSSKAAASSGIYVVTGQSSRTWSGLLSGNRYFPRGKGA